MNVLDSVYQEHIVFKEIQLLSEFYDSWSTLIMGFMTSGTKSILNIDTYVYTSMKGTLDSLLLVLKNGHISDGYTLLRKFHDAIIMNVYTNMYLHDHLSLEKIIVNEINGWLNGIKQLPNFRGMTNYIKDNNRTKELYLIIK